MNVSNAKDFLAAYAPRFVNEAVREMVWAESDDDFGRTVQWPLDRGALMECVATFDLQSNCCTMTVTERDLSDEAVRAGTGSIVALTSLVSFDEQTVQIDGEDHEFSDEMVRQAIAKFNELAV